MPGSADEEEAARAGASTSERSRRRHNAALQAATKLVQKEIESQLQLTRDVILGAVAELRAEFRLALAELRVGHGGGTATEDVGVPVEESPVVEERLARQGRVAADDSWIKRIEKANDEFSEVCEAGEVSNVSNEKVVSETVSDTETHVKRMATPIRAIREPELEESPAGEVLQAQVDQLDCAAHLFSDDGPGLDEYGVQVALLNPPAAQGEQGLHFGDQGNGEDASASDEHGGGEGGGCSDGGVCFGGFEADTVFQPPPPPPPPEAASGSGKELEPTEDEVFFDSFGVPIRSPRCGSSAADGSKVSIGA